MGTRSLLKCASLLTLSVRGCFGARIVQANDDGWAELYIRSFNDALNAAGHDVVLSAPAENESGTGSLDIDPWDLILPCEYDSCSAPNGPTGNNATEPRLNWVNSFPATAMRYGIDTFGPQFWGNDTLPDLAVTGPNVGSNLYLTVLVSATVGAAVYAAHDAGVPAIAFSGASTGNLAWDTYPVPARSLVYAELSTTLVDTILVSGAPYLPDDVFLNVNFPEVEGNCTTPSAFKWVLSRINPYGILSTPDTETCGNETLPTETSVVDTDGCYIAVSVGNASDKTTADADSQAVVLDKLSSLLSCLPA